MTSATWVPQPLDIDEARRRSMTGVPRRRRSLTVERPWGWTWWPGSELLIAEDPDVTDQRSPRAISKLDVDWYLVLHAVRYAVSHIPDDVDLLLRLDQLEVAVPFGLSDDEHRLAQSWVGKASPVTYWAEEADIRDGRHRLWLSRPHYTTCDVPLFDEHLSYLDDVRAGDLSPQVTVESIAGELAWWAEQGDPLRRTSARHRDVLIALHLELAPHEPLPPEDRNYAEQHHAGGVVERKFSKPSRLRTAWEAASRWVAGRRSP